MGRPRRNLVILAALVVLVLVVTLAPPLVAQIAARRASERLGTAVRVGWLGWNPFSGWWTVEDVSVAADRGPAALRARRVAVRLYLWDLVRGEYRVRNLALDGARVRLRATAAGWELPLPPGQAAPPPHADEKREWPAIAVERAHAHATVVALEPEHGQRSTLHLRRLAAEAAVDPQWTWIAGATSGRLDRGPLRVAARVRTAHATHRIRVDVTARNVDLARAVRLVGRGPARELRGTVDLRARYDDALHGKHRHQHVRGRLAGHQLAVGAHGRDGMRIGTASVPRFAMDLVARHAALDLATMRGVRVAVERGDAGIAVAGVLSPGTPPGSGAAGPETSWTYDAAGVALADTSVAYLDAQADAAPVVLRLSKASVGRVGAPAASVPFSLDGSLESGGRVGVHGEVVREPLAVTAHADLDGVALPALAALAGAPVAFESATGSAHLDVGRSGGGIEASGTLEVSDVKTISPDPQRPENVLAWKSVQAVVRRARLDPPVVDVESVKIAWPYVLVDRTPESIFPLYLAAGTAPGVPADGQAPPPGPSPAVRIGRLTVEGARIDFRDAVLQPPYWRALAELAVTAEGVELPAARVRRLEAKGLIDEISPLSLEGTVGTKTHLRVKVDKVALPPFNAYLTSASAYSVSSGVVSGESEVILDRSELEVSNRIVLSRFGLENGGDDEIEREVGIPLTLALALMKDYRGDISLSLPFGGDLKAPTFSVRSVVVQALARAIKGAVLSPLNALGRVFLNGDKIEGFDLAGVPFAPGDRQLTAAARERMTQIARVVAIRPELALRVRGTVAAEDVQYLQDAAALAALKDAAGVEPQKAFLRARLAGAPPPALADDRRRRLDTLIAGLPWPAEALQSLAVDRGAASAAAFVTDFALDAKRVSAVDPVPAAPDKLGARPEASIELAPR